MGVANTLAAQRTVISDAMATQKKAVDNAAAARKTAMTAQKKAVDKAMAALRSAMTAQTAAMKDEKTAIDNALDASKKHLMNKSILKRAVKEVNTPGLPPGWTTGTGDRGMTYYTSPEGTAQWEKPSMEGQR